MSISSLEGGPPAVRPRHRLRSGREAAQRGAHPFEMDATFLAGVFLVGVFLTDFFGAGDGLRAGDLDREGDLDCRVARSFSQLGARQEPLVGARTGGACANGCGDALWLGTLILWKGWASFSRAREIWTAIATAASPGRMLSCYARVSRVCPGPDTPKQTRIACRPLGLA
jgi:hypothetical protein